MARKKKFNESNSTKTPTEGHRQTQGEQRQQRQPQTQRQPISEGGQQSLTRPGNEVQQSVLPEQVRKVL